MHPTTVTVGGIVENRHVVAGDISSISINGTTICIGAGLSRIVGKSAVGRGQVAIVLIDTATVVVYRVAGYSGAGNHRGSTIQK